MDVPLDLNPFDEDTTKLLVDLGIWIGFEGSASGFTVWMGSEEAGICVKLPDEKNELSPEDLVDLATILRDELEITMRKMAMI